MWALFAAFWRTYHPLQETPGALDSYERCNISNDYVRCLSWNPMAGWVSSPLYPRATSWTLVAWDAVWPRSLIFTCTSLRTKVSLQLRYAQWRARMNSGSVGSAVASSTGVWIPPLLSACANLHILPVLCWFSPGTPVSSWSPKMCSQAHSAQSVSVFSGLDFLPGCPPALCPKLPGIGSSPPSILTRISSCYGCL